VTKANILLVGESWITSATHFKGFDQFGSVTFHLGAEPLVNALRNSAFDLTYMPSHEAAERFPFAAEDLTRFQVILLSDIGANTLLLPPSVWLNGKPVPNRLRLLRDWAKAGGGLAMIGGYLSFQGIDGRARWHRTLVEDALPVTCLPYDDRIEVPEGFQPEILQPTHPIVSGIDGRWPLLLGANEVAAKEGVQVIARLPTDYGGHPLLVAGQYGKGRTAAWTSDIGPHWVPTEFLEWDGYGRLWRNLLGWLSQTST
jgi:uncharacterized membrane protein